MRDVLSLETGEVVCSYSGSLSPADAVIAASEQARGNWSTWTYPASDGCPGLVDGPYGFARQGFWCRKD